MKVTYTNRNGDDIIFNKINDDTIKMSGFEYFRTSTNDDGIITMIDPSGGPYIQVGSNLNRYFNIKENMIVKTIKYDNGILLLI